GIRGGISIVSVDAFGAVERGGRAKVDDTVIVRPVEAENTDPVTSAVFFFGDHMNVTLDKDGSTQSVLRPGFEVVVDKNGMTRPSRTSSEDMAGLLARVQGGEPTTNQQQGDNSDPNATRQVNSIASDRVGGPEGGGAPTLADILGSQAPGNQS
ncbi:MAG: hypothetical protein ABIU07_09400, partial [Ramlibacter sp.]